MSDGNYNRNLLPYHQYASGLKAGKAQMHTLALRAFFGMACRTAFTDEVKRQHELRYRELLNASVPAERKGK